MGKERCWRCKKVRTDVALRSTDDRLCQSCFDKNEAELDANRNRTPTTHNSISTGQVRATPRLASAVVTSAATSKVRQLDSGKQPIPLHIDVGDDEGSTAGDGHSTSQAKKDQQSDNELRSQVEELAAMIVRQNAIIEKLTGQLNIVLEFLDISDSSQPQDTLKAKLTQITTSIESRSYSHPESSNAPQQRTADQKEILAAVHTELQLQRNRKRNVVVTGLKPLDGVADANLFEELCEKCLPVKPAIIRDRCRRLGKQQPGKIRPLLVTLRSDGNAAELLQSAKLLKNSPDGAGIYINPDLTPAEAQAAYERRQRIRHIRSRAAGSDALAAASALSADALSFTPLTCLPDGDQPVIISAEPVLPTRASPVVAAAVDSMPSAHHNSFLA
jgi:hypothetical protein